jgi:hypothetical protein
MAAADPLPIAVWAAMRTAGPSPVLVLIPAALLMSVPSLPAALLDGQVVDWTSCPLSALASHKLRGARSTSVHHSLELSGSPT